MEKKDLIISEYADYTFEDLEVEEQAQTLKANNVNLSPVLRRDALDRLEVLDVVKDIYMQVAQRNVDVRGLKFGGAFHIATGKSVNECVKPSVISKTTSTFVSATDKAVDKAFDVTKTGLHKFGAWLAEKTK